MKYPNEYLSSKGVKREIELYLNPIVNMSLKLKEEIISNV